MYDKIKVTGIVIASMPVGELDRRVTILTKERGKISAFARGARRPTSALLACSQVFSYGSFILFEKKDSYDLDSADIKSYFGDIRNDMDAIWYGMYFCEFALYMSRENVQPKDILNLLYVSLRALEKGVVAKPLIRRVFELRYLSEDGERPEVFACLKCKKTDVLERSFMYFDAEKGGLICPECADDTYGIVRGIKVNNSLIYTMQYIVSAPLEKLFGFTLDEQTMDGLNNVVQAFLDERVGHRMKTEDMLT